MKVETSGNVIGFPDVNARGGYASRRKQGGEYPAEEAHSPGFLSTLRNNVENAEQLVSRLEPGEQLSIDESDASRREDMLDIPFFGTLLGAVATKMASASIMEQHRSAGQGTQLRIVEIARDIELDNSLDEGGLPASGLGKAKRGEKDAELWSQSLDDVTGEGALEFPEAGISKVGDIQLLQTDPMRLAARHGLRSTGAKLDATSDDTDGLKLRASSQHEINRSQRLSNRDAMKTDVDTPDQDGSTQDETLAQEPESHAVGVDADTYSTRNSDRTPTQQIAENIKAAIPTLALSGQDRTLEKTGTIRFKLHPENLGDVEVTLKVRGDKLEIGIVMERSDAARVIMDAQDDLRSGLNVQGLSLEFMDISVGSFAREAGFGDQPDLSQQGGQQSLRQDSQAGTSGSTLQGRSGSQNKPDAWVEDGNVNSRRFVEENAPRILRNGLYL